MVAYSKIFPPNWFTGELRDGYPGKVLLAAKLVLKEADELKNTRNINWLLVSSRHWTCCPFYRLLLVESLKPGKKEVMNARREVILLVKDSERTSSGVSTIASFFAKHQLMEKVDRLPPLEENSKDELLQSVIETKREVDKWGNLLVMLNLTKQELHMHAEASKN
jgi:hypothetical protein